MKTLRNDEELEFYLSTHSLETIFNDDIKPFLKLYQFEMGELICSQGQPALNLFVLVKGKLKIYTTSPEGKTLILSFLKPPEMVGDIEYVQGVQIINTVEAVSPVLMIGVDYSMLNKFSKDDSAFLRFMLEVITQKFYLKSTSMSFNMMYPVEVRLASYLLSITHDENNSPLNGQMVKTNLTDTANLIGTSYRHLNRVLLQLSKEGLIERKNGTLLIKDRNALRALATENIYE